jgi:hypothetical protein
MVLVYSRMNFQELNDLIPWVTGKTRHVVSMSPYNAITLAMPGRHAEDTDPVGGDFVVMVSDDQLGWINHQFTHDDLFADIERKARASKSGGTRLMDAYAKIVVNGKDPEDFEFKRNKSWNGTLHPQTLLYSLQCLAVAEHRRYWQHERRGGGRYLPARFSSGIVEGIWTAADAKAVQRRGRIGLEQLIKEKGKPTPLRELASR